MRIEVKKIGFFLLQFIFFFRFPHSHTTIEVLSFRSRRSISLMLGEMYRTHRSDSLNGISSSIYRMV